MFSRYIAFRTVFHKRGKNAFIIWIGVIGIAISACVIQIAMAIHGGFKQSITDTIFGYESQLQIGKYNAEEGIASEPIRFTDSLVQIIQKKHTNIQKISHYILMPSLAQSKTDLEGIMFKGVSKENTLEFFKKHLIEGTLPHKDSILQVIVGKVLTQKLQLKVGDKLKLFFMQNPPKARVVKVVGVFQTNMYNIDENTVIGNVQMLNKVLGWEKEQTMGLEIWLKNTTNIEQDKEQVKNALYSAGLLEQEVYSIYQLYPNLFNWIDLQGGHVRIIILLMLIVATMNMTCTLLVLILEQTKSVGILKAIGASENQIRLVFIYQAGVLIAFGSIIGNVLGTSIILIQEQYHFLKLNPESYFLSYVPMKTNLKNIIFIDIGIIFVCTLFMLFPALYSKKISPIKALRTE